MLATKSNRIAVLKREIAILQIEPSKPMVENNSANTNYPVEMKIVCPHCQVAKSPNNFGRNKNGLTYCKQCLRQVFREWRMWIKKHCY